jgi:sporulation protein YlmC with PRC-barrel domain
MRCHADRDDRGKPRQALLIPQIRPFLIPGPQDDVIFEAVAKAGKSGPMESQERSIMYEEVGLGMPVYDSIGEVIGEVQQVYVDEQSHEVRWLAIVIADNPSERHLVPISGLTPLKDGFSVPHTRDQVMGGPLVPEGGLSGDVQRSAESHYGSSTRETEARACITREEAEARGGSVPGPALGNVIPTSASESRTERICDDDQS